MIKISDTPVGEALEKECREDLDKLVSRTDIPREGWVSMAVSIADRTGEDQWKKIKKGLRDRAKTGRKFAKDFDNQSAVARARGFAEVAERLNPLAESLRNRSDKIGKMLRENGNNHNHTLIVLLNSVLKRNQRFNCWEALSRVIARAYLAAGRETEAEHMTADTLLKTAKRYCKGDKP
jgi:hypothetical protein